MRPAALAVALALLVTLHDLRVADAAGKGNVGAYRLSRQRKDSRLDGCLLEAHRGLNMTSLCAAACRQATGCESFSHNERQMLCHLHNNSASAAAACSIKQDKGWTYFPKDGFLSPQPPVSVCSAGSECSNKGVCLSRTEVTDGGLVCACSPGYSGDKCQDKQAAPEWSAWSEFGTCSVTCGVGLKMRERRCLAAGEVADISLCGAGSPRQYTMCNTTVCPSWSGWSEWSRCSTANSCGQGVRQRSRNCTSGGVIGKDCLGGAVENTPCESVSCGINSAPVSLEPLEYEPYVVGLGFVRIYNDIYAAEGYVCADGFDIDKEGDVVCRSLGFQGVKTDGVTVPDMPSGSGKTRYFLTNLNCAGTESSLQKCQHAGWSNDTACTSGKAGYVMCKVNGGWSQWSAWQSCDGKCGAAQRNRTRTCNRPQPLGGGAPCPGAPFQESACPSLPPCPVNGSWHPWSSWSSCSAACGGGVRNRSRSCRPPQHGGSDCEGASWQSQSCATDPCPVDGYYKPWSSWSSCKATCGGGRQWRTRLCVPPAHSGKPCAGPALQHRVCNDVHCPVHGQWSAWSAWSSCNASCSGGTARRQRLCDSPAPSFGGSNCTGRSVETKTCGERPCPVDGFYSKWSNWSSCSRTCGGGAHSRNRSCVPPKFGGQQCQGEAVQNATCNAQPCPIDGMWLSWSSWSGCNATCGGGWRRRQRQCRQPLFGGRSCTGQEAQLMLCNRDPCPVHCKWSAWSAWSACSASCDGGQQRRDRSPAVAAEHGGKSCQGEANQTRACGVEDCAVPGKWSAWTPWTGCSVTCGGGSRRRSRSCRRVDPDRPMRDCSGPTHDSANCHSFSCFPLAASCAQWRRRGLEESATVTIRPAEASARAFCNATDNSTTLGHTRDSNETLVHGYEGFGEYRLTLNYTGGLGTAVALATSASRCVQYLSLRCKHSLKNVPTQPGHMMTWWNNRRGQSMASWGGVANNATGCSCGTTGSCVRPGLLCNCDANDKVWRLDSGFITDTLHLPITSVQVGDTGNTSEYSSVLVGPLICWHAAA